MEDDFELFHAILEKHGLLDDETPDQRTVCAHSVIVDETCVHCSERIADRSNFANGAIKRRFGSSIAPDLENRGFSDSIIDAAQEYFRETQANSAAFRGKMRSAIIAACVYHALLKSGTHASFGTVSKRFGLEKKVASKGFQRVKMCVEETRNHFETPEGVATWIVESVLPHTDQRRRVIQTVNDRFARVRLSPASLRASVAAVVYLLVADQYSCETVAEAADASLKKVIHLSSLFRKR